MSDYAASEPVITSPTMECIAREVISTLHPDGLWPEETGTEEEMDQAAPALKQAVAEVVHAWREKRLPAGLTKHMDAIIDDLTWQARQKLPEDQLQRLEAHALELGRQAGK